MNSPLTLKSNVALERQVRVDFIVEKYREIYGIDVARFFAGETVVSVYRCLDTGFRFYHPFTLDGDSAFYMCLQAAPNYYIPWKWEHQISYSYFEKNVRVLEVGSGGNGFVMRLQNDGFAITGLELNDDSVARGQAEGLDIRRETIQEHAMLNPNRYDVVCSFQVLEHIADPLSFLKAKVKCLKSGGMLIISVPNNQSDFLKYNFDAILNMPPHHMGLWDEFSLCSLENILDVKRLSTHFEPLQDYHVTGYTDEWLQRNLSNRYIRFVARKLGLRVALKQYFSRYRNSIVGHSILMIFTKN